MRFCWGWLRPGRLSLAYFFLDLRAGLKHARAYHPFLNGLRCRAFLESVASGIKEGNVLRVEEDAAPG
jgi:hypothetical protein